MLPFEQNKKSDHFQLLAITAYLQHTHMIPEKQIKHDWFVLINPKKYDVFGITQFVVPKLVKINTIIHNPDIMILDRHYKLKHIIELDGYSHKTESGLKKTARRNQNYTQSKISFTVLDIDTLRRTKKNWFDYIDESLHQLKILDLI